MTGLHLPPTKNFSGKFWRILRDFRFLTAVSVVGLRALGGRGGLFLYQKGWGVVWSFETVQGFTSIQYQFLGELELDLNRLEALSR